MMTPSLSPLEIRILGSLIEKQMTTPDYYPMTLNGLTNACNQKTARNPVTQYEESDVHEGLESLREKKFALRVDTAGSRTAKFRHQMEAVGDFEKPHLAVLCILLLRGPQTLGEIRTRSERLYLFRDLAAVDTVMQELIRWEDPNPMAVELPKEPGRKEKRYSHLLGDAPQTQTASQSAVSPIEQEPVSATTENTPAPESDFAEQLKAVKEENRSLREAVDSLRAEFEIFKKQFD